MLALACFFGGFVAVVWIEIASTGPSSCSGIPASQCAREWIGAIGGWAAALVAIPTIILLLRQTDAADRQSNYNRADALRSRLEEMRSEHRASQSVIDSLRGIYGVTLAALFLGGDDRQTFKLIEEALVSMRDKMNHISAEIDKFSRENPYRILTDVRQRVSNACAEHLADVLDLRLSASKVDFDLKDMSQIVVPPVSEVLKMIDKKVYEIRDDPVFVDWRSEVSNAIAEVSAEIDELLAH